MSDEMQAVCCEDGFGELPACAPLANPYVPFQPQGSKTYGAKKGMARGTLFPGLDLPFLGMVNQEEKDPTPLEELQALGFAIHELGLYLDTHQHDREAIELMSQYLSLYRQGRKKFQEQFGALTVRDSIDGDCYTWMKGPWPWEFMTEEE